MGSKLNRHAYEGLIEEDVARVMKEMPDSLEREHVIQVLRHSVECYYPRPDSSKTPPTYVGVRPWIAFRDRAPAEKVAVEVTNGRYRWDAYLEDGCWVPALTHGAPMPTHWREIISLGEDSKR